MKNENIIKQQSEKLEKLGMMLSKNQYNFKVKETASKKYWKNRIEEFEKYHSNTIEYFIEAYQLMKIIDSEQSEHFLLRVSRLKQLGRNLLENLKKINQNPSIMDLKDQQKSRWTIEQRELFFKANNDCLDHEKRMNIFFKEFYEKHMNTK